MMTIRNNTVYRFFYIENFIWNMYLFISLYFFYNTTEWHNVVDDDPTLTKHHKMK